MSSLSKRLMMSAVFISIALATIFLSPDWFFVCVVMVFSTIAFYEFLMIVNKKGVHINRYAGLLTAAILPLSIFKGAEELVLVIACLVTFLLHFRKEDKKIALITAGMTLFGLVYVVWFFSFLIKLRMIDQGASWVFYVLLLVKGGDAGAYFFGSKYGKIKLIEHISPNKSVEGAIAGLITTVVLSVVSGVYVDHVSFGHLLLLGIIVGVLSQVGDLIESLIKRDAGVKDSGQIPGLGGILDMFDSLLLTIPTVYYYLTKFVGLGVL